jgi:hypothetical protein
MTEQQWLACHDPQRMLQFLRWRMSERKLQLFACGCCRLIWDVVWSRRSLEAVVITERFLDGLPRGELRPVVRRQAWEAIRTTPRDRPGAYSAAHAAHMTSVFGGETPAFYRVLRVQEYCTSAAEEANLGSWNEHQAAQADLLRDLIGNPFRSAILDPSLRDATVIRLAQTIHEEGRFDEIPVLGDALEEAGCPNQELIDHCHQTLMHYRGCWVVDTILAKE